MGSSAETMATKASASQSGAVVVYVTVPDDKVAKALASSVVQQKLAACVSIIPGIRARICHNVQIGARS